MTTISDFTSRETLTFRCFILLVEVVYVLILRWALYLLIAIIYLLMKLIEGLDLLLLLNDE
jgi:hypothetical protein